jgi:signal transduction histidine kinase
MAATAAMPAPAPRTSTFWRRLGNEALYLLTGSIAAAVAFCVWVTGITLSLTLGLLIIGFPIVLLTFMTFRLLADVERRRAALVLGEPLMADYRPAPATERGRRLMPRLRTAALDPQTWKDTAYLFVLSFVGTIWGVIWGSLWAVAFASIVLPVWWWAMPADAQYLGLTIDTWEEYVLAVGIGVALIPISVYVQRALAVSQAQIARWMLSPSLAARVERLTETRAGAVDVAAAELRRIERDLHDGAQARLVALAMDLGMAEERFDRDPESARELVGEAREEAKRALAELRDLARGIRPSLLTERGLGPAISALAARSPVPARAQVDITRRPPAQVETAAWFVVSEALANTAKHSGAQRATVWVTERGGDVHVEVVDDGRGGADPNGTGLHGLTQRVEALDGSLEINSPPGGPTVIRAVLPCA